VVRGDFKSAGPRHLVGRRNRAQHGCRHPGRRPGQRLEATRPRRWNLYEQTGRDAAGCVTTLRGEAKVARSGTQNHCLSDRC